MKYKITVGADEAFIQIIVYESITGNMEREFAAEAIAVAKQNNVDRYLVDVRGVPNIANTFDQYWLSYEHMRDLDLAIASKIAILVGEDDTSHDFVGTVFRNAGYVCRLFVDEDNARNWLFN